RIFVGSMNGLYRFDPAAGRLVTVPKVAALSKEPVRITALAAGKDGRVWVGTYDEGLVEFDPASERAILHREQIGRGGTLSDDRIACLAFDRAGSLWIGTWGGGLDRMDPSGELFTTLGRETRSDGGPASLYVMALLETSSGDLLVGLAGGLDRRDAAT